MEPELVSRDAGRQPHQRLCLLAFTSSNIPFKKPALFQVESVHRDMHTYMHTHTQTLTCAEAAQAGKQLEDKRRSTLWGLWPTGTCSRVTPSAYGKPFSLPLHVTHRGLPTHSSAPPPGLPAAEPGVQAALAPGGCLHPLAAVCGFGFVLALFLQNHRRGHTGGGGSEADLPND